MFSQHTSPFLGARSLSRAAWLLLASSRAMRGNPCRDGDEDCRADYFEHEHEHEHEYEWDVGIYFAFVGLGWAAIMLALQGV
jgi:hypothetical protein